MVNDTSDKADALYDSGDYEGAFSIFLEEAKSGDPEAMLQVALMYGQGEGVTSDFEKSIYWDKKAISEGNDYSILNLAITYRMMGDLVQYKHWLEKSLESGHGEAALLLAKLYMVSNKEKRRAGGYLEQAIASGNLVEVSLEEAEELLASIADQ